MRETVARYERRTGRRYRPPASLRDRAEPLRGTEACPTLFRYPGPLGLRDYFLGTARRLASGDREWTWYHSNPSGIDAGGIRHFGLVAILEPMRLHPCRAQDCGVYLADARLPREAELTVWVPPAFLARRVSWDRIRRAGEFVRRVGQAYEEERARTHEDLGTYLEELSAMERAGAPGAARPWSDLADSTRRRRLAEYGVTPTWTALRRMKTR